MRRPEPWYRASKSAWFVQFGDKQIRLPKGDKDATEKEAFDAYYKLMAHRPEHLPKPDALFVAVVCDLFLDHSKAHHEPDTCALYKHFLQSFCKLDGRTLARDLTPFHVTRWLDQHPSGKPVAATPRLSFHRSRGLAFPIGPRICVLILLQISGCLRGCPAGEYLGGLVFYEFLYGTSAVGNKFRPEGVDDDYARFLQDTAHKAVDAK